MNFFSKRTIKLKALVFSIDFKLRSVT